MTSFPFDSNIAEVMLEVDGKFVGAVEREYSTEVQKAIFVARQNNLLGFKADKSYIITEEGRRWLKSRKAKDHLRVTKGESRLLKMHRSEACKSYGSW